jgi:hypothetical protein
MSTKNNRVLNPEGGRYPFKVSDEDFDNLTARIMAKVDEAEQAEDTYTNESPEKGAKLVSINDSNTRRNKRWLSIVSIATSLAIVATVALKFIPWAGNTAQPTDELVAEYTADDYNEALMTYTMADNMDVYCYLESGDDMGAEDAY